MIIAMDHKPSSLLEQLPAWQFLSAEQRFWFALGVDAASGTRMRAVDAYGRYLKTLKKEEEK